MSERTMIIATTEPRFDGHRFSIEQLLKVAEYLNRWGERKYFKEPSPLPQFQGYPGCCLRAWVAVPPGSKTGVLYVRGDTTPETEKALSAARGAGQVELAEMLIPVEMKSRGGESDE
jgi:hypothetical protein